MQTFTKLPLHHTAYLTCINNNIRNTETRCSITSISPLAGRWERELMSDWWAGTRLTVWCRELAVTGMTHKSSFPTSTTDLSHQQPFPRPLSLSLFVVLCGSTRRTLSTMPVPRETPSLQVAPVPPAKPKLCYLSQGKVATQVEQVCRAHTRVRSPCQTYEVWELA